MLETILVIGLLSVVDGDTVRYQGETYRLQGLNTPETHGAQCESERQVGDEAKDVLVRLVREAKVVEIRTEHLKDRYQRSLGRLYIDGRSWADMAVTTPSRSVRGWMLAERYDCPQGHCPRRRNWCENAGFLQGLFERLFGRRWW